MLAVIWYQVFNTNIYHYKYFKRKNPSHSSNINNNLCLKNQSITAVENHFEGDIKLIYLLHRQDPNRYNNGRTSGRVGNVNEG